MVESRDADLDGPGRDGIDNLIINVKFASVEDLDGNRLVALPLDFFLEVSQNPTPEALSERNLDGRPKFDLLSFNVERE